MKRLWIAILICTGFTIVVFGQGCNEFRTQLAVDQEAPNALGLGNSVLVQPEILRVKEGGEITSLSLSIEDFQGTDQIIVTIETDESLKTSPFEITPQKIILSKAKPSATVSLSLKIGPLPFKAYSSALIVNTEIVGVGFQKKVPLEVLPVDAPNVFLLVGQSNMVGSSLTRDEVLDPADAKFSEPGGPDETHPQIFQLNVTSNNFNDFENTEDFSIVEKLVLQPLIIQAEDPLHINGKSGSSIGPGLSFAKAVREITEEDIILVPAAWGNTGFCVLSEFPLYGWNPNPMDEPEFGGTGLFDRAVVRTNLALEETNGVLRGIIWQQGERDENSDICAERYKENLTKLFENFRNRIAVDIRGAEGRGPNSDVPIVVGTNSRGRDERGDYSQITPTQAKIYEAQKTVSSYIRNSGTSIHDDIVPPEFPCGSGSCIHFGAKAYREMGRRYFEIYKTLDGSAIFSP